MVRRARAAVTLPNVDYDLGPEPVVMRRAGVVCASGAWVTPLVWRPDQAGVRRAAPRKVAEVPIGARSRIDTVVEDVPEEANGRKRRRSRTALERMGRDGRLEKRQVAAGEALARAWDATQRSPSVDLSEERVDRSPRPDERTAMLVDRQFSFGKMSRAIPRECRGVVFRVCCEGLAIRAAGGRGQARAMIRLRRGLDALAAHLGY